MKTAIIVNTLRIKIYNKRRNKDNLVKGKAEVNSNNEDEGSGDSIEEEPKYSLIYKSGEKTQHPQDYRYEIINSILIGTKTKDIQTHLIIKVSYSIIIAGK